MVAINDRNAISSEQQLASAGFKSMKLWRKTKGQKACAAFVAAVQSNAPVPIAAQEIFGVSRGSIEISEVLRVGAA